MSAGDLAARFAEEAERVGSKVVMCDSLDAVHDALTAIIGTLPPDRVASCSPSVLDGWGLDRVDGSIEWLTAASEAFRERMPASEVGVTGADVAIADTGTLVLTADADRPRSLSLLPRVHVALIREEQIVAHMAEAIQRVRVNGSLPSAVQFMTGPSRSADIENDLSIGVHGPAEVHILVLRS
jgi:L-lactate dehydrogenase complex protein LldG